MKKFTHLPGESTIFSQKAHLRSMKKAAGLQLAKVATRRSLQFTLIAVIGVGLLLVVNAPVLAGNTSHRVSHQTKVHKRVDAHTGNKNHFGGGRGSQASVHNNNSVTISTRGGSGFTLGNNKRNNNGQNNNHRNNNEKKVVKKKVVRKDIDINKTIINKNVTTDKSYGHCFYRDCQYHYDTSYNTDQTSYNPCGGYTCYRDSYGRIIIVNNINNSNTNENYNRNENYNSNENYLSESSDYYKEYYYNGY